MDAVFLGLPPGLLKNAGSDRRCALITVHEVQFQPFAGPITAIGTYGLRSCYVVILASRSGAIMAHIAPYDEQIVGQRMDEFQRLYQEYGSRHFGAEKHPWLVTGLLWTDGSGYGELTPWLANYIRQRLQAMGLYHREAVYGFQHRYPVDSPSYPGKGTVFVDGSSNQLRIYVEDNPIQPS